MPQDLWTAMADPNRRAMLNLLRGGPRTVNEVADALTLPQPSVSKHLKILRAQGLVDVTADAQRRVYRLEPGPLAQLDDWLAPYRERWNISLDLLDRHLEKDR